MSLLSDIIGGITDYQVAKQYALPVVRPNSPFIPDFIEYGVAGAPATTKQTVTYDNATGQVIGVAKCKRRRRRRRLATKSDIADLAALKAIIGGGKALDAWIATNGRR